MNFILPIPTMPFSNNLSNTFKDLLYLFHQIKKTRKRKKKSLTKAMVKKKTSSYNAYIYRKHLYASRFNLKINYFVVRLRQTTLSTAFSRQPPIYVCTQETLISERREQPLLHRTYYVIITLNAILLSAMHLILY